MYVVLCTSGSGADSMTDERIQYLTISISPHTRLRHKALIGEPQDTHYWVRTNQTIRLWPLISPSSNKMTGDYGLPSLALWRTLIA